MFLGGYCLPEDVDARRLRFQWPFSSVFLSLLFFSVFSPVRRDVSVAVGLLSLCAFGGILSSGGNAEDTKRCFKHIQILSVFLLLHQTHRT